MDGVFGIQMRKRELSERPDMGGTAMIKTILKICYEDVG
jgi:hypothetical protein